MNKVQKISAAIGVAALVGASGIGGALVGSAIADDSVEVESLNLAIGLKQAKIAELEAMGPVIINETIVKEVPVNVTQTVEVDNGNLDLVLEEIYDNEGNIDYIVEDLDDDELDLIVDRIVFANDVKAMAIAAVKADLFDELDNVEVTLNDSSVVELDEDELERLRIDDDDDEVVIDDIDYDDKDAEVTVTGRFRDEDDVEYDFEAVVEIESGKIDEIDSIVVTERV